ncbi:MAG: CaiB/BaiF CoA transferase family protein [Chloroflexota bacterium]
MTAQPPPGPLADLRVLDLSRVLAGPYCAMMLGDMGASVIKVEQPGSGDDTRRWGPPFAEGESAYFLAVNRNKRSITLNIKEPRGQEILQQLVARSDVLIENFKHGTLEHLGFGYDALHAQYPKLIYCSISGYGADGPYANRPGYDIAAQAMGGLMSLTGAPDGDPMKAGLPLADLTTGLFACSAVLGALHHCDRTGLGQRVDLSLLESIVALLVNVATGHMMTGAAPERFGNAHPNLVPYQLFETRDGSLIAGAGNDRQFADLCAVLDLPELGSDHRFQTNADRVMHRTELIPLLQSAFLQRDSAAWTQRLLQAGVMAAPILGVDQVLNDPQVLHRQMRMTLPHSTIGDLQVPGIPYKLNESPASGRTAPPLLGQHTDEILSRELGLDDAQITALRAGGVI